MRTEDYARLESLLEHYNYMCQQLDWSASNVAINRALDDQIEAKQKILNFVEELLTKEK